MGALRITLSEYSSHDKISFADATRRSLSNQPLYVSVREAREESKRQEFVTKENEKRKTKEQNICIRGLAESDDDNPLVKEICDELGDSPRLVETKKIDDKRKDKDDAVFHSGPRHLIVKLETVKNKLEILRSASKRRSSGKFRNVYINQDLTALEAKELFEMRKECEARNEKISSDDDKWIIFRGSLSQRSRLPALRRLLPRPKISTADSRNSEPSFLCFNTRSLISESRRKSMANFMTSKQIDIACFTETWLFKDMTDPELFLPDYSLITSDRISSDRGTSLHGGVLIAIKGTIQCTPIDTTAWRGTFAAATVEGN